MQNETKTNLIVLQSTPFCNIACKYCYLPERNQKSILRLDKFERILNNVKNSFDLEKELTLLWHSGEPFVLGSEYYEKAIAISDKIFNNNTLSFNFQTNGLLLTSKMRNIYRSPRVKIGLSLDGTEQMHDAQRVNRNGSGTFGKVMDAVNLLNKESISFSVICVLNEDYLERPDLYDEFFTGIGVGAVTFLHPTNEGVSKQGFAANSLTKERLTNFYKYFVKKKLLGHAKFAVSPVDGMIDCVTSSVQLKLSHDEQHAYRILSIGVDGQISTFSPELAGFSHEEHGSFYIGNAVNNLDIDFQKLNKFQSEIDTGIKRCKEQCEYFEICGGGLPTNKFFETGRFDSTEHTSCQLGQILLANVVAEEFLKQEMTQLT